jgi:hypothetical protein
MATFSHSVRHVKQHLDEVAHEHDIVGICRKLGHRWRQRQCGPVATVQLVLIQLLAKVSLEGLRRVAQVSASAQSICSAKMRLPLKLLLELVRRSVPGWDSDDGSPSLWRGLKVLLVDGTSFMVPDKPKLVQRYGKARNQRGTSAGYPMAKLLALMDRRSGFIRKVIALPCARQEFTCLSRLFKAVGLGALLMGDRGLVSFTHLALMVRQGIQGCFRLPRGQVVWGRGKASRRLIKRLGKQDLLVQWSASQRPTWMSKSRWEKLKLTDTRLTLRQISFRVCRRGFRVHWAWIITTLLDPQQYPAQELIELYSQRWQIEVYFRDLKQTLGMKRISAQTEAGVQKELAAFVLLYNLVRRVMQRAAVQQGTTPDRISFIDASRWLLWTSPGEPLGRLKVNPIRVRRSPPRRLKNARHRYPQLNASRRQLSNPPYRVVL